MTAKANTHKLLLCQAGAKGFPCVVPFSPRSKLEGLNHHFSRLQGFYVGDLLHSRRQTWLQPTVYQKETPGNGFYLSGPLFS